MTNIPHTQIAEPAVTCSTCAACCCQLEVMLITDTGVPDRFIDTDDWGGEVMLRLDKSWWQTDTGRVTGYWSGAYTYWDGDKRASVSSLSFSPVFVYEFAGERVKPYIEAGVGVAVFSRTRVEDNNIGQAFQFEDRLGFGLRFVGGSEVGIRATHYSNAGISSNNDGVESYSLHYTMPL